MLNLIFSKWHFKPLLLALLLLVAAPLSGFAVTEQDFRDRAIAKGGTERDGHVLWKAYLVCRERWKTEMEVRFKEEGQWPVPGSQDFWTNAFLATPWFTLRNRSASRLILSYFPTLITFLNSQISMKRMSILFAALSFAALMSFSTSAFAKLKPGLYAKLYTQKGTITLRLFEKRAPKTVANFVGLADGSLKWEDPRTKRRGMGPLYSRLKWHRVVKDFVIQTGDPTNTGGGGPGFIFDNEIHPELTYDKPGMVGMANRGPNTNGSQFFITMKPTPFLTGGYSIFAEVAEGMDVVMKIRQDDDFDKVEIFREK